MFYYFKPSLFFEMSLKFFAHSNSCYDFDFSDVSQKVSVINALNRNKMTLEF